MYQCWRCERPIIVVELVGRQDLCEGCRTPLRSCRNCKDWDRSAHNQCREPQADYVADRENGNFCAFFKLRLVRVSDDGASATARASLEAAFGGATPASPQHADEAKARLQAAFGGDPSKPAFPEKPANVDPRTRLDELFKK